MASSELRASSFLVTSATRLATRDTTSAAGRQQQTEGAKDGLAVSPRPSLVLPSPTAPTAHSHTAEPTHRSQRATSAAGRVNVRSLHTSQHFLRAVRIYNVPTRVGTTTHCRKCHLQMVQLLQQLRVTELLCALWSVGQCLTD